MLINKRRNETVWSVHTLPTKCEGCLTSLPLYLLQKPLTETALLYILDQLITYYLINAIDGSQQVSALDTDL